MTKYEDKNVYQLFFNELIYYEDMEKIFQKFDENLEAKIIEKIDGPYSRIWKILIKETEYKLIIDEDYGGFISAENENSIVELKKITPIINKFIK
jgi:hypothetical protein